MIILITQVKRIIMGGVIDKNFKPQPQYNAPMTPMAIQQDNTQWIMSAKTNNYYAPIK